MLGAAVERWLSAAFPSLGLHVTCTPLHTVTPRRIPGQVEAAFHQAVNGTLVRQGFAEVINLQLLQDSHAPPLSPTRRTPRGSARLM